MDHNISLTRGERILYFLVSILLPVASFLITTLDPDYVSPVYVNENLSDYALILLRGDVSIYFYPFLVYAIICMFLLLWSPERYSKRFFVRFGIYTGLLLALQYSIFTLIVAKDVTLFIMIARDFLSGIFFLAEGLIVPGIIKWMFSLAKKRKRYTFYIIFGLFLLILLLLHIYFWDDVILLAVGIFIFIFGPFWCFIISINISIKLLKIYELSKQENRKSVVGLIAWLVPFLVSWRLAYIKMLQIYSSFPPPPHCYIATAVAKGHPSFVKSKPVDFRDGCVVWVNAQLRTFKCAELLLSVIWPKVHQIIRAIYDVFGPPLARLIVHPIQADLVYIILKPVEWVIKIIMRIIIPDFERSVDSIYKT